MREKIRLYLQLQQPNIKLFLRAYLKDMIYANNLL